MKTAGFIFSFRLPSTHSTLKIACIFSIFLHRCLHLKRNPLKSDCDRRISSGMLVVTNFDISPHSEMTPLTWYSVIRLQLYESSCTRFDYCSYCPRLWLVITFMLFITYDRWIRVMLLHFTTNCQEISLTSWKLHFRKQNWRHFFNFWRSSWNCNQTFENRDFVVLSVCSVKHIVKW